MSLDHKRFDNIVRDLVVDDGRRCDEVRRLTPAERCYLIVFTARSGSTWLTSLLSGDQPTGIPRRIPEPAIYLQRLFGDELAHAGHLLGMLIRRRKTANGVFGMEVRHIDVELFGGHCHGNRVWQPGGKRTTVMA